MLILARVMLALLLGMPKDSRNAGLKIMTSMPVLRNCQKLYKKFFEEAAQFSSKGEVILQGDINARTGTLPDFLTKDKYDEFFGIENHDKNPPRNSEDRKV